MGETGSTSEALSGTTATSSRGQSIVDAWNAGDRAHLIAQLADDVVLEARLPKVPTPMPSLVVTGKKAFAEGLANLPDKLPRFSVVNAVESDSVISLVLEDEDRQLLVVGLSLNEDGRIDRITSFRPDR